MAAMFVISLEPPKEIRPIGRAFDVEYHTTPDWSMLRTAVPFDVQVRVVALDDVIKLVFLKVYRLCLGANLRAGTE